MNWFALYVIALCLFAGVGIAYLFFELIAWLESRIDDGDMQ